MKNDIHASVLILKKDKRFVPLIKKYGEPDLKRGKNPFQALVRSIVYQQLSGKAAATILKRYIELFPGAKFPTAEAVCMMSIEKMRAAGLSSQKVSYIKDLALKFSDGTIKHRSLHRMTTSDLIEHLIQVKGVGVWTVHMFLIFTLNRPDVLPTGDLGIRKGFQILYRLKTLPDHKKMELLAKPWRAHATVASWYLWKVADEEKVSR
jgi:DNA-3-methyladenine glycosylase II